MKKLLIGLGLILIIALAVTEFMLPGYFAEQIEVGFRQQVEEVDSLEIGISTHPALLLFAGRIQNGFVEANGVQIQGLRIDKIEAVYNDLMISETPDGVKAVSGVNSFFQAAFREEDLTVYLRSNFPEYGDLELDLTPEQAAVTVWMTFFDMPLNIELTGDFEVVDNRIIRFIPEDLEIVNYKLPKSLVAALLQEVKFDLEIGEYPLPLTINEVRLEEGRILILGGSR